MAASAAKSAVPTPRLKAAEVRCPACEGGRGGLFSPDLCFFCDGSALVPADLVPTIADLVLFFRALRGI